MADIINHIFLLLLLLVYRFTFDILFDYRYNEYLRKSKQTDIKYSRYSRSTSSGRALVMLSFDLAPRILTTSICLDSDKSAIIGHLSIVTFSPRLSLFIFHGIKQLLIREQSYIDTRFSFVGYLFGSILIFDQRNKSDKQTPHLCSSRATQSSQSNQHP